jgi:hypothetical protein
VADLNLSGAVEDGHVHDLLIAQRLDAMHGCSVGTAFEGPDLPRPERSCSQCGTFLGSKSANERQ